MRIIFLTNAVISSLAVPAAAMLVLAVFGSWPQAVCAALLLAVLPQHLRFSAAEDLFVQAITFGLWSLALFASYQRTRRQEDALLGASRRIARDAIAPGDDLLSSGGGRVPAL